MKYDERINERNLKTFKRYEMKFPSAYLYNCVICKEACCIENSMSSQGNRMICMKCVRTKFDMNTEKAFEWVNEPGRM